jgi:hypothetical protein
MVNANKTKWLVVEDFVYDSVTTAISSPATMDEPNTTLVMANAGNATVTVPATSKFRNGDFFRVIAKGAKSVTLQLDQSDSGNVDFYAGSVNLGVNPTIQLSNGRAIYAIWSAGDASFYIESQLGTAASLDVGTSAGNLVQLDGTGKLPAIDGSQLTGIATGSGRLSISNETASFTAVKMKHHSVNTLAGSVTATLPLISTVDDADVIRIKLASRPGTNNLSVVASGADTIDGSSASILLQVQGEFIEVIANSATNNWEIIG